VSEDLLDPNIPIPSFDSVLQKFQKLYKPLPSLPFIKTNDSFVLRDLNSHERVTQFIEANMNGYKEMSQHRKSYAFLYCINGSGFGKTEFGKYIPHTLRSHSPLPLANFYINFLK
jgi:hypothetical protein